MLSYPPEFLQIISVFSKSFSKKVFSRGSLLLLGTILTHGGRTICSVLRTLGLDEISNWDLYHRVLSRANWSPHRCSASLLGLLLSRFVKGPRVVLGIDETLERRWGPKIGAKGYYYDSVHSTKKRPTSSAGLRWLCLMLLSEIPWANRLWALPFLTVLTPSAAYNQSQGKRHKKLSDWARQICYQLHRWLPDLEIIILGDGAYAVMALLQSTSSYVSWITRFRWDATLYEMPSTPPEKKRGRPAKKGKVQPKLKQRLSDPHTKWQNLIFSKWYSQKNRPMQVASGKAIWFRAGKACIPIRWVIIRDPKGKLEPMALQTTNLKLEPKEVIELYLKRWQVEVSFQQVRTHLGVETQRQWAPLSIQRTTPVLMALFSIITLWADQLQQQSGLIKYSGTWYKKQHPTFSDALAAARNRIWEFQFSLHSTQNPDCKNIRDQLYQRILYMATRTI